MYKINFVHLLITLISTIITAAATIYAAKYGIPKVQDYVKERSCLFKIALIMIAPFVTLAFIVFVFFAFLTVIGYVIGTKL